MDSIANARNKEPSANDVGHQYNWQHFVLVTKYRYKMFGKQKTRETVKDAIYDVASRKKIGIMEFAFGEDFAHIHILLSLPPTLTVSQAAQLLKGILHMSFSKKYQIIVSDIHKGIFGVQDLERVVL